MRIEYAFLGSVLALLFALLKSRWIYRQPVEGDYLKRISGYVADGAMAFLSREFRVLAPFVLVVATLLAFANGGLLKFQGLAFILGAGCSALAGFLGMKVATAANSRTTTAATTGLNEALTVSFSGGTVMGMNVVGLGLLGIFSVLFFFNRMFGSEVSLLQSTVLPVLSGFSFGASSMALFARVGGGIYTKAADVGADLVGKVEAGIPEDDPRNPATIADNVGDNVGDVAGMGADLFESYVGSMIGAMILGLAVTAPDALKLKLASFPLIIGAVGVIVSIIGVFFVRTRPGASPQKALNRGLFVTTFLTIGLMIPVTRWFLGSGTFNGSVTSWDVYFAMLIGLIAGAIIGLLTEFFTGTESPSVRSIVKSCETGSATTLITGISVGMLSAFPSVVIIAAAILGSYFLAGFYGIAIAGLGMLMVLGIQLAVDAYGPIADNAGGLAVMAEFPPEVRKITDSLDAVGNTTAAIGKGFAIGSAALTAIIIFSAFTKQAGLEHINLMDVPVVVGILLGVVIPYLFSSIALNAVGKAAFAMIAEVRRQFRERPGILEEKELPDYKRCVDISTKAALKEMLLPGLIAVLTPIIVGFVGGVEMLTGTLIGVTGSGVVLAIFMANSGGAWDNAKKVIEGRDVDGKGTPSHAAAVVGDTVGDPFKDTAGPSLNILIKLMAIVSLVIAPILKNYWGY